MKKGAVPSSNPLPISPHFFFEHLILNSQIFQLGMQVAHDMCWQLAVYTGEESLTAGPPGKSRDGVLSQTELEGKWKSSPSHWAVGWGRWWKLRWRVSLKYASIGEEG